MKRKTHDEFVKEMREISPELTILGQYERIHTPILVRCNKCGNTYQAQPGNLLSGYRCRKCWNSVCGLSKRMSQEEFERRVAVSNPSIEVRSPYIKTGVKVKARCKECGHEWMANPVHLSRGHGCPVCWNKRRGIDRRMKNDTFVERLRQINNKIKAKSTYVNSTTKIKFECEVCGCIWEAVPNAILQGEGCPKCVESKGERKISTTLESRGIAFVSQKRFEGCKRTRLLPFDFYVPSKNTCIEFDGSQHYMPVDHFGGLDGYLRRKENDKIKENFCKDNGIKLVRIRYDDDIEKVLMEALEL